MKRSSLVLGIETSSRLVGVALLRDGEILSSVERLTAMPRADDLRQIVEQVLGDAHATLANLTGLAVSIGPGSFTGLRIGVSFVKGLAMGHRVPVVGIPTLDVIAQNGWGQRGIITVLLDARQSQVYAANFQWRGARCRRLGPDQLGTIAALRALLTRGTLLVGDGARVYAAAIRRQLKRSPVVAPQELWWPRAATVARLGAAALARGRRADPITLMPRYLYPSDCTIKRPVATGCRDAE